MDDGERNELVKKLDEDIDEFIKLKVAESAAKRSTSEYASVADMSVDELAEELKNHPAFMTEFDETKPMSPAMEALQALKYESDSTDDNAESYKEDGNKNFGMKKYRWAIDNYTAGIKCKPREKLLNAVLYTNRAAANYHIGNYRSSLTDCVLARKFQPQHYKAILRGCQCCLQLRKYCDAIRWCDEGLELNSEDSKLIEIRSKAVKSQREAEKEKRKVEIAEKKKKQEDEKLLAAIKSRGVKLQPVHSRRLVEEEPTIDWLTGEQPGGARAELDAQDTLHWPVVFVYPECGEMDFISAFNENDCLLDHINAMFGKASDRPGWDEHGHYTPDNIEVYFEEKEKENLIKINTTSTLLKILQNPKFMVYGGSPSFILLSTESNFYKHFLSKYNL